MSGIFGSNSGGGGLTLDQLQAEATNATELAAALANVGTRQGQVIAYIGATPAGFADVDAPALVPTASPEWRLRAAPCGGGGAWVLAGTFCAAGDTLFGIYWDGLGSTYSNVHAAIWRSTDYETTVVKSTAPFAWQSSSVYAVAASAIDADRVLVCVSVQGYNYVQAFVYTISTDSWVQIANFATGSMTASLSMVTLNDGRVMCQADGLGTKLLNPTTLQWSAAATNPQNTGCLFKLADGSVLSAGQNSNYATSNATIYNPATNTWAWTTSAPGLLGVTDGFLFANGKLAVSCGTRANQFYIYDPATATWATDSLGFNKGSTANNLVAFATTASGQVFVLWGYYKGQQVIGNGSPISDTIWAGWHQLEFKHPDIAYLSSNLRSIVKV